MKGAERDASTVMMVVGRGKKERKKERDRRQRRKKRVEVFGLACFGMCRGNLGNDRWESKDWDVVRFKV